MILEAIEGFSNRLFRRKEIFHSYNLIVESENLARVEGVAIVLKTPDGKLVLTTLPNEDIGKAEVLDDSHPGFGEISELRGKMLGLVTGRCTDKVGQANEQVAVAEVAEELGISVAGDRISKIENTTEVIGIQTLGIEIELMREFECRFYYSHESRQLMAFFSSVSLTNKELKKRVVANFKSGKFKVIRINIKDIYEATLTAEELAEIEIKMEKEGREVVLLDKSRLGEIEERLRPVTKEILKNVQLR